MTIEHTGKPEKVTLAHLWLRISDNDPQERIQDIFPDSCANQMFVDIFQPQSVTGLLYLPPRLRTENNIIFIFVFTF